MNVSPRPHSFLIKPGKRKKTLVHSGLKNSFECNKNKQLLGLGSLQPLRPCNHRCRHREDIQVIKEPSLGKHRENLQFNSRQRIHRRLFKSNKQHPS